jgi:hypothetical protein
MPQGKEWMDIVGDDIQREKAATLDYNTNMHAAAAALVLWE